MPLARKSDSENVNRLAFRSLSGTRLECLRDMVRVWSISSMNETKGRQRNQPKKTRSNPPCTLRSFLFGGRFFFLVLCCCCFVKARRNSWRPRCVRSTRSTTRTNEESQKRKARASRKERARVAEGREVSAAGILFCLARACGPLRSTDLPRAPLLLVPRSLLRVCFSRFSAQLWETDESKDEATTVLTTEAIFTQ